MTKKKEKSNEDILAEIEEITSKALDTLIEQIDRLNGIRRALKENKE